MKHIKKILSNPDIALGFLLGSVFSSIISTLIHAIS